MKLTAIQRVWFVLANATYRTGLKRVAHYFNEKYHHAVANDERFVKLCNDFFNK